MTVKELYEWAKDHNAEYLEIEIQCRDSGGDYSERDENYLRIERSYLYPDSREKVVVL